MKRRFGKVLGVAGLTGLLLLVSALAIAQDAPRFSGWSEPVNLGPVVNAWGDWTVAYDACPTISKDGLSLYFRSNRPGHGSFDIWVSQRDSLEEPWGVPANLGPTINGPYGEYCTTFSPDGRRAEHA